MTHMDYKPDAAATEELLPRDSTPHTTVPSPELPSLPNNAEEANFMAAIMVGALLCIPGKPRTGC
jgi:hypothetical protein